MAVVVESGYRHDFEGDFLFGGKGCVAEHDINLSGRKSLAYLGIFDVDEFEFVGSSENSKRKSPTYIGIKTLPRILLFGG